MLRSTRANLILLLITAIWGMTFPLVQMAVQIVSPAFLVLIRFALAAILFIPFIIYCKWRDYRLIFWAGLFIGIFSGASYLFQAIGLLTIPASRSAFITSLAVVLVPLFMPFFKLGHPRMLDYVAAVLCLVGIYILSGASFHTLSRGDAWTFLGAVTYSLALLGIQVYSAKYPTQVKLLAFYQILFTIPLAAAWLPPLAWSALLHTKVWIPILYCTVLATCVVFYLQMRYQKDTTPTKAVLIFTLEPVFATFFAYLLQHEVVTRDIFMGGAIIIISTILTDVDVYLKTRRGKKNV